MKKEAPQKPARVDVPLQVGENAQPAQEPSRNVGLTVRIEINLPIASDQETYDKIFKSIKENLIDG